MECTFLRIREVFNPYMVYLVLLLGLATLVAGAELLVRGAVSLAEFARISPLVIGLTVVAFGTSAPELAVSSMASLKGDSAIALGNVVGSNIFNVLLILGISAVIVPLSVSSQLVKLDVPIMVAASIGVGLAGIDGLISRVEGAVMLLFFAIYTAWLVRAGRKESKITSGEDQECRTESASRVASTRTRAIQMAVNAGMLIGGLALLVLGARFLVDSATAIARDFGVSDLIIGLTIVAAGTSLPELATSIVAAIKGQRDIAVGNVVGSNVFNILVVLSSASVLVDSGVPVPSKVISFDLAFMVGVAILCFPIFVSNAVVSRWEGALMLVFYVAYTGLLIADSMQVTWAANGNFTLTFIAMPVAILACCGLAWIQHRRSLILPDAAGE